MTGQLAALVLLEGRSQNNPAGTCTQMAQQLALGRCSPCPQKLFGIPKKLQWKVLFSPTPLSERGQSVGGHEFHCFIVIETHTFLGPKSSPMRRGPNRPVVNLILGYSF